MICDDHVYDYDDEHTFSKGDNTINPFFLILSCQNIDYFIIGLSVDYKFSWSFLFILQKKRDFL